MSTPSIAERVAAGAVWLDKNRPGWWKPGVIDLERLSVASCVYCMLGQLFGYFEDAPEAARRNGAAPSLGFDRTSAERNSAYPALTAEWRRVIQERRTQAGATS